MAAAQAVQDSCVDYRAPVVEVAVLEAVRVAGAEVAEAAEAGWLAQSQSRQAR